MNSLESLISKDTLNAEEIKFLRNYLKSNVDFSRLVDLYVKHNILDKIAVDILLKRVNDNQIALITSGSLPINYNMYSVITFLLIKNYPDHYKSIFELMKRLDGKTKRDIIQDYLFTGEYLTFLIKLMKNDPFVVSELIAAGKIDEDNISILATSSEPEVLFRVSNLKHILSKKIDVIRLLLENPFTPDESLISLKQLTFDLNLINIEPQKMEEDEEIKEEKLDKPSRSENDILDEISKDINESLTSKIAKMSIPEKIKLALKGNKSARMILIKDPNKQISINVLSNPKITEDEISFIVKNKATPDHIIREIARNNTWMNNYNILRDLMFNPKTPLEISMSQLSRMSVSDLEKLAKSRDVPSVLKNQALRMFTAKTVKKV